MKIKLYNKGKHNPQYKTEHAGCVDLQLFLYNDEELQELIKTDNQEKILEFLKGKTKGVKAFSPHIVSLVSDAGKAGILIPVGARVLLPTGLHMEIPVQSNKRITGEITPRSGLALQKGLTIPNSPGKIDADYRDEVKVIVQNNGEQAITLLNGERIAQFSLNTGDNIEWENVDSVEELQKSNRKGGFGSTGA